MATAPRKDELEGESEGPLALEGFELVAKLGRGCAGATYDARRGFEPAIVKVLSKRFQKHDEVLAPILDDLRRAKGFSHENVVALVDTARASGRDVLVFERARGKTLAALLEDGPLPSLRATEIVLDVARGLAAAHARGLVHGDVRPEKVFMGEGRARLADFGLARASCLGAGFGQLGLSFGHPTYLAPEALQEKQRRPSPASDVYALGILHYELVCGRPPFRGETFKETLREHLEKPLPPPPDEVSLSTSVASLILKMTAKSPGKRFPTIDAAIAAIETYLKARKAGLTSDADRDPKVDAPLAVERRVSGDEWGKTSNDAASRSDEWAAEKIESAERVGPAEWLPDESQARPSTSGLASRGPVVRASGFRAGKPPSYVEAVRDAAKAEKKLPSKAGEESEPAAGMRFDLKGDRAQRAHERRTQAALALAALCFFVLLGLAYAYGRWKRNARPPVHFAPGVDPDERPAEKAPDESIAALEHDRKVRALGERLAQDVRQLAKEGDFRRALDLARLVRLDGAGDAELRTKLALEPSLVELRSKLVSEVMALARERLARETKSVDDALAQGEVDRADAIARTAKAAAPDELAPLAARLGEAVARARERAAHPFGKPAEGSPDKSDVETAFRAAFPRARATFTDGGGVELEWRGEDELAESFVVLSGKPRQEKGALRLDASQGPVLLVHRLPFLRPVSARVELVAPEKRGKTAVLALLAGADGERESGAGVSWTLAPSRLDRHGLSPLPGSVGRLTPLSPGSTHALALSLGTPGEDGSVVLSGSLDDAPGERTTVDEARLGGGIAIYAKDVELSVVSLKIAGIADLEALGRLKKN